MRATTECDHCGTKLAFEFSESERGESFQIRCAECQKITHVHIPLHQEESNLYTFIIGASFFYLCVCIATSMISFAPYPECSNENFFSRPLCIGVDVLFDLFSTSSQQETTTPGIEPKKELLCSKIESSSPLIRDLSVSVAGNSPGNWNIDQLVDLYSWVKANIRYVNDPVNAEYFASATETLTTRAGDCDDQAILVTSMIKSVGGNAKLLLANQCNHAFAAVFVSSDRKYADNLIGKIGSIYSRKYGLVIKGNVNYLIANDGVWLIVDPAGGSYLGDILPACKGTQFTEISC